MRDLRDEEYGPSVRRREIGNIITFYVSMASFRCRRNLYKVGIYQLFSDRIRSVVPISLLCFVLVVPTPLSSYSWAQSRNSAVCCEVGLCSGTG